MSTIKILTVYLGDVKAGIEKLRRAWGHESETPMSGTEAAWMRGYTAACNEITLMISRQTTFAADPDEPIQT